MLTFVLRMTFIKMGKFGPFYFISTPLLTPILPLLFYLVLTILQNGKLAHTKSG